jgi:PAS domain S-box-containing protein
MQLEQVKELPQNDVLSRRIVEWLATAILYFLVAKGGLAFASINASTSPIWPPTGLAVALVLIRGYHILPAIAVAAFLVNVTTTASFESSFAIALGNTLEAGVAVYLLNTWGEGRESFSTPAGIAKFAIIIVAVATPLSATVGSAALILDGLDSSANPVHVWTTWWLGDVVGAIVVAPAITLWSVVNKSLVSGEEAVTYLLASLVGLVAFSPAFPEILSRNALSFLAILPLLWAALRHSPRETSAVALILSAFAIWGVTAGQGPFIQPSLNESFLLLMAFISSAILPSLALSAAVSSRQNALQKHEASYQLLIDSVPDYAIFMLDSDGRVVSWNTGAQRIKQYSESEIVGHHFRKFYTSDDQTRGIPEHALDCARKFGRYESDGWRVRRDGSRFWASAVLSAVRNNKGKLLGFAKVTRDMTEKHQARMALESTRAELVQAQKMEAVGQLTGGIAHDFNNLLMAISAGVRMLGRAGEQRAEIIDAMNQAVERGTKLTRQLLTFARRETLQPEIVNAADRLQGMRSLLDRSLREDIIVEINCEAGLWSINVDPNQFELAILNLAVNARDAMPNGGLLLINARNVQTRAGDYVCISVTDSGTGMSPEVQAKAFEPFFTTKAVGRGTGLGLSQVYGFATQAGGTAQILSQEGKGTTLTLTLPRAHGNTSPDKPVDDVPLPLGSGRVLVVEDDSNVALVVMDMLKELGYQPLRAGNAEEALRMLQADKFDLVFSDVVMPGSMDGIELAEQIQRRFPTSRILLTTGYLATPVPANYPIAVLRKPYGPQELARAIGQAARIPD